MCNQAKHKANCRNRNEWIQKNSHKSLPTQVQCELSYFVVRRDESDGTCIGS
jgi:hypothetical protein